MTRKAGRVRKLPEKEPDKRRKGERRRRKRRQKGEQRKSLVREEAGDRRKRLQSQGSWEGGQSWESGRALHSRAMWPWEKHYPSLTHGFLVCKRISQRPREHIVGTQAADGGRRKKRKGQEAVPPRSVNLVLTPTWQELPPSVYTLALKASSELCHHPWEPEANSSRDP